MEANFEKEKQVVNTNTEFSTNFGLPDIVNLDSNGAGPVDNDGVSHVTFGKGSKVLVDDCNNYFTHERNKYLLVFQTAKRFRDLMKVNELSDKQGFYLLVSLSLCRRGLLMIDFLTRTLQNKVDIFKLDGF